MIPSKIRRKFGIKEDMRVQVEIDEQAIRNLRGKYKGKRLLAKLAAEKKREKEP